MPAEKNTPVRFVVTVIVAALAVLGVWAVFKSSKALIQPPPNPAVSQVAGSKPADSGSQPSPDTANAAGKPDAPKAADTPSASQGAAPAPKPEGGTPTTRPTYRARAVPLPAGALDSIGSIDPATGFKAQYTFSHLGAGVDGITLADQYQTLQDKISNGNRFQVQQQAGKAGKQGETLTTTSLAARAVIIDGAGVDLFGDADHNYWTQTGPGTFEAFVVDEQDKPVLKVTRRFEMSPGSYEVAVHQSAENLSGRELEIEWIQYGPLDIVEDASGYRINVRRVRYGFLLEPQRDPSQSIVEADGVLEAHDAPIQAADNSFTAAYGPAYEKAKRSEAALKAADPEKAAVAMAEAEAAPFRNTQLFPRPGTFRGAGDLVWLAQTSRYFTFAVHPLLDQGATKPARLLLGNEIYGVPIGAGHDARLALEMHALPRRVKPGESLDLSFSAYAGPLAKSELSAKADPRFGVLGLSNLVVFNLGSCCSWCTFQWLAVLMLQYLDLVHYLLRDWTLAIIVLVLTVRTILHPITRKSQISMSRFGKKMAALAPKQKKIQEQYAGDPKQMQLEMARLMKEEGISPTQALGCLPTFLQTPVWIALYAMLYFAFQFRHQGGFYGVFQAVSGGHWSFLADLSAPDHFIEFGRSFEIPVVSAMMGPISGINLLPLILGVVFFIQQKYLSPPPSASMTPEQEAQQKMMKVMMVVMFPVMMYNAPSGLAVYFITNSTLGILEGRYVRAHIDELDKNPPPEKAPGWGRKKVENQARSANPFARERETRRFKDR